jgi:hypothetical protein
MGYCEDTDELNPLDKNCKESVFSEEDAGYMRGYKCFYPNKKLMDIYLYFIDENIKRSPDWHGYAKLRRELIVEQNLVDSFDDDYLWVSYGWEDKKTLTVSIEYEAGSTEWTFKQKSGGVEAVSKFYFQ